MPQKTIWKPSQRVIDQANVTRFMERHEIKNYEELIQRATTGVEWFWDSCTHETGIAWFEPYTQVLDMSRGIQDARWFVGGTLNIAHNCLDRHAAAKRVADKTALIWQGECGAVKKRTYRELAAETGRVANHLKAIGVTRGDFVGLYLPMIPELIPVFYAILKIGAVMVPIFSGFGTDSVVARFRDAGVKVVFTVDGTLRRGKELALKAMLDEALAQVPTLEQCIVIKRLHLKDVPLQAGRDVFYDEVIHSQPSECATEELPSEHTALVIYTSGTTGKPKGTVHTHVGVLAQVSKELYFNFDLKPNDTFFWVTDIGWMMGPWEIIGTHHFGATLVIIEGAPNFPDSDRVVRLAERFDVTHLGVSPTLIRLLMREGLKPRPLKKLRILGSTGEPWDPESYLWCFQNIGAGRVPIINISGGTEIMGCLLAPLPIRELKPCSLQSPGLGMAVDVFTEGGYSAARGEVGYLVCKKPAPSMTKGFLNDRERYLETYFSRFKNVWNHGDWAVCDADGHWYLRGRADDTIKIAGKRLGPAEVESVLCGHPFVSEACAIGVPDALKGEALVCFVVLQKGIGATPFLAQDLGHHVARRLGKTLAPQSVHLVESLAKTRSGKIVRGTIKRKYLGLELGDLSSLDNPGLLEAIPHPPPVTV
jgi:acetyl-CoA synthetase